MSPDRAFVAFAGLRVGVEQHPDRADYCVALELVVPASPASPAHVLVLALGDQDAAATALELAVHAARARARNDEARALAHLAAPWSYRCADCGSESRGTGQGSGVGPPRCFVCAGAA